MSDSEDVEYDIDKRLLKDICPTYSEIIPEEEVVSGSNFYLDAKDANLLKLRDDYRLKVESGNNYVGKLLDIEKKYFEEKYGPKIYNYLKEKRDDYMNKEDGEKCQQYLNNLRQNNSEYGVADVKTLDENFISNLLKDISNGITFYNETKDYNTLEFLDKYKNATSYVKNKMNEIDGKNNTTTRKIEYRNEELMNVNYTNNLLTITYYVGIIVYFMLLISSNNFNLNQNYIFYAFLILFPIFIYPVFFSLLQKIYNFLVLNNNFRGPKSAFLNNINPTSNMKFIDDFNV